MKKFILTVALLIAGSVSYATDNFTGVIACTPEGDECLVPVDCTPDGECQYEVETR